MSTWHFFVRLCGCPWVPTSPTLHMFIYFVRVWFWVRLSLRRSVSSADFKCRPPLGPKFLFSPVLWHSDFYAFNYYLQFEPLPPPPLLVVVDFVGRHFQFHYLLSLSTPFKVNFFTHRGLCYKTLFNRPVSASFFFIFCLFKQQCNICKK